MEIVDRFGKTFIFNIVVIGTGATGSQLLPFLTQLMNNITDHHLTVVDGDLFEKKNTRNQKCLEKDINKSKAEVLGVRYKKVYPEINIYFHDQYIKNEEDLKKILCRRSPNNEICYFPVLIGCVDNNATRKLFHNVFYDEEIPQMIYIDSGNGTDDMIGQTVIGYKRVTKTEQCTDHLGGYNYYNSKPVTEIVLKPAGDVFPGILEDKDTIDKVLSCANHVDEAPQNIATNVMAATTLFCILNNLIAFNEITEHVTYFDAKALSMVSRSEKVKPNESDD